MYNHHRSIASATMRTRCYNHAEEERTVMIFLFMFWLTLMVMGIIYIEANQSLWVSYFAPAW